MSKMNPLAGLIANYGDSDDSEEEMVYTSHTAASRTNNNVSAAPQALASSDMAGIHPAPIAHCPWSACYDESSGFTYYWNQKTNAVTWEAPPEYLLALKIARQQLHSSGSAEVSAEEWQLYQQALAEKQNLQNKVIAKAAISKSSKKHDKPNSSSKDKKSKNNKKRPSSEDDDEKIELITSYHNSDSESNDETSAPETVQPAVVKTVTKPQKNGPKKQKTRHQVVEYGPSMPPNLNYPTPIGPELPPQTLAPPPPKSPEPKVEIVTTEKEEKKTVGNDNEDSQDESSLLKRLKDKAKLLATLGGELPSELQQMIRDETNSSTASPRSVDDANKKTIDIDDLLEEIEKTEFVKPKKSEKDKLSVSSANNSPRSDGSRTPPLEELKSLFPSTKNITGEPVPSLFPSAVNVEESSSSKPATPPPKPEPEKKENIYLMDANEPIENVNRKKLRISNSVLPERKNEKIETPAYTTKYSQYIEGFSDQRTGLGFKEEESCSSPKNTISYGNGLTFTKGETLNEGKKDEDLDDMTDLVEAKLKYLNELQPCVVTPVQEMLIQLQTLVVGARAGGVTASYMREWLDAAGAALTRHEAGAAPPGWTCAFQRSEGRYRYRRDADGLQQWEYPALDNTDMDISTTPPHQPNDVKEELPNTLLTSMGPQPAGSLSPVQERVATPPPPKWPEPPPPGCDDPPPLPTYCQTVYSFIPGALRVTYTMLRKLSIYTHEFKKLLYFTFSQEQKKEIGDELTCFYNDIAELEKQTGPSTASNSPEPPDREKSRDREARAKKKTKVKISASMGLKHKSVSSLVAKWQQVAEEIHSD
ncbi:formin-binding protein 4-like [Battus philenor]|uniref:formin-binding protein 4-like n=1 Tax=Battus philenor TaxID=42288 RepID=UPI0035CEF4A1